MKPSLPGVQLVITPDLPKATVVLWRHEHVIISLETQGESRTLASRLLHVLDRLRLGQQENWGAIDTVVVNAPEGREQVGRMGIVVGRVLSVATLKKP